MSAIMRAARRADVEPIWKLVRALAAYEKMESHVTGSAARLEQHLFDTQKKVECLVAEDHSRLVGYAIYFPIYSTFRTQPMLWLEDLFVLPEARGKGIGRALLAELSRTAIQRGCWRLDWAVLNWNEPSIKFYERLGARRQNADWLIYGFDEERLRALAATSSRT